MHHKIGDKVEITTKDKSISGIFINEEKESIFIKLDSGYNMGIDKIDIPYLQG